MASCSDRYKLPARMSWSSLLEFARSIARACDGSYLAKIPRGGSVAGVRSWAIETGPNMMKTQKRAKALQVDVLKTGDRLIVIRELKRGALEFGGKDRADSASCNHGARFGAAASIRIKGVTRGLQIGGRPTNEVQLIMNRNGTDEVK